MEKELPHENEGQTPLAAENNPYLEIPHGYEISDPEVLSSLALYRDVFSATGLAERPPGDEYDQQVDQTLIWLLGMPVIPENYDSYVSNLLSYGAEKALEVVQPLGNEPIMNDQGILSGPVPHSARQLLNAANILFYNDIRLSVVEAPDRFEPEQLHDIAKALSVSISGINALQTATLHKSLLSSEELRNLVLKPTISDEAIEAVRASLEQGRRLTGKFSDEELKKLRIAQDILDENFDLSLALLATVSIPDTVSKIRQGYSKLGVAMPKGLKGHFKKSIGSLTPLIVKARKVFLEQECGDPRRRANITELMDGLSKIYLKLQPHEILDSIDELGNPNPYQNDYSTMQIPMNILLATSVSSRTRMHMKAMASPDNSDSAITTLEAEAVKENGDMSFNHDLEKIEQHAQELVELGLELQTTLLPSNKQIKQSGLKNTRFKIQSGKFKDISGLPKNKSDIITKVLLLLGRKASASDYRETINSVSRLCALENDVDHVDSVLRIKLGAATPKAPEFGSLIESARWLYENWHILGAQLKLDKLELDIDKIDGALKYIFEQKVDNRKMIPNETDASEEVLDTRKVSKLRKAGEALTALVNNLDWVILPPEAVSQISTFKDEIENYAHAEGISLAIIDWGRLENLRMLAETFNASIYRSREGFLESRSPYFVAVFRDEYDDEIAIAENPQIGNATYITRSSITGGEWDDILIFPKKDAIDLGAQRIPHGPKRDHIDAILDALSV